MTFAHYFIDISHNIFNLWMRLIFPETKHPRLQFEHKNEAIPIIWAQEWGNSDQNWVRYDFSKLAIQAVTAITGKPNFTCSPLSLNGILFIFPLSLPYKPPYSFIISWSFWDSRYWLWLIFSLLSIFFLHP